MGLLAGRLARGEEDEVRRYKDIEWELPADAIGTWERVGIAVQMDIRDKLGELLNILRCPNFQAIPAKLERISRNTAKPKRKGKARP